MESQQSEIGNWQSDAPPQARVSVTLLALGAATLLSGNPLVAGSAPKLSAQDTAFFESKIRPVLVENCYKCHSQGAEKVKGGLLLDTRDEMLKGGDTGPAIIRGDPEKSLLIKAVRYIDEDLQMPPRKGGGRLTTE